MPYASQRDRPVHPLEISKSPWPLAPLNMFMRSGFQPGVIDLTWDDPADLSINSAFGIIGVNIYRAFDSEYGPFERITTLPLGSKFWRDQTNNVLTVDEDVSARFTIFGQSTVEMGDQRFVFKTLRPIVKEASQNIPGNAPDDVQVFVDGQLARIKQVIGATGEVELDCARIPEVGTQNYSPAVTPTTTSKITCTYRYNKSLVKTDLLQRVFYRVTTVGVNANGELVETPLENAVATSTSEIEKLDYIWREAVRRNRWILEQGGERVKVFLRKTVGPTCSCVPDDYHGQPINDCPMCYGTSILHGYEGPYDILIAPDDGERKISQKETGRAVEHSYEVWTGPVPILSQRDFIVKLNGERYSIGAVRFPSNRGMVLQQHFNIGHIDEKDIRVRVPLDGPRFSHAEFMPSGPELEANSDITNKPNIPEERQLRGRSLAWSNIVF